MCLPQMMQHFKKNRNEKETELNSSTGTEFFPKDESVLVGDYEAI